MTEARKKILKMVADGILTVEQADELIGAIETETPGPDPIPGRPSNDFGESVSAAVAGAMEEAAKSIEERIIRKRIERKPLGRGNSFAYSFGSPSVRHAGLRNKVVMRSKRIGGRNDVDTLVQLAVNGIKPQWVQAMKRAFGRISIDADSLFAMSESGVTPEMVDTLRNAGFTDLDPESVIALAVHCDPDDDLQTIVALYTELQDEVGDEGVSESVERRVEIVKDSESGDSER